MPLTGKFQRPSRSRSFQEKAQRLATSFERYGGAASATALIAGVATKLKLEVEHHNLGQSIWAALRRVDPFKAGPIAPAKISPRKFHRTCAECHAHIEASTLTSLLSPTIGFFEGSPSTLAIRKSTLGLVGSEAFTL